MFKLVVGLISPCAANHARIDAADDDYVSMLQVSSNIEESKEFSLTVKCFGNWTGPKGQNNVFTVGEPHTDETKFDIKLHTTDSVRNQAISKHDKISFVVCRLES